MLHQRDPCHGQFVSTAPHQRHRASGHRDGLAKPVTLGAHREEFCEPVVLRTVRSLDEYAQSRLKRSKWALDGVDCARERHGFRGQHHGFAVEVFTFARAGKRGWTLMVDKEFWWIGEESKDTKVLRWVRPTGGPRTDIIALFRQQESMLERSLRPLA